MQPAIDDGLCRRFGVLPIARHDILSLDNNLTALSVGNDIALGVTDLQVQVCHDTTARSEDGVSRGVGADNRRCLTQAIALEHRHTHGTEIALQLDVEQRTATDKEFHTATEALAHAGEDEFVEQFDQRSTPCLTAAAVPVLLIIFNGVLERKLVEFLHKLALCLDACLDALAEITRQSRNGKHDHRAYFLDRQWDILQRSQCRLADRHRGDRATVGHHGVEACHMRKAVVERKNDEHDIVGVDTDNRACLLHIGGIVAVGEQDTLRVCRRSRGVRDVGVVVGTY